MKRLIIICYITDWLAKMRKGGSQSMYQPNQKSMAVSKVIGNNSITGLQGRSMINNSNINASKKVEGHDFSKTSKTNF